MATGTPVIAYKKWGSLESVVEWRTGIFFENQTITSINKAIEDFEEMQFSPQEIREQAKKFDKKIFQEKFLSFIEEKVKN